MWSAHDGMPCAARAKGKQVPEGRFQKIRNAKDSNEECKTNRARRGRKEIGRHQRQNGSRCVGLTFQQGVVQEAAASRDIVLRYQPCMGAMHANRDAIIVVVQPGRRQHCASVQRPGARLALPCSSAAHCARSSAAHIFSIQHVDENASQSCAVGAADSCGVT